jgi:hypothetical protein
LSFSRSDSSQATLTMKSGFRNSDGWNCAKPHSDPALGPVHLVAEQRHEDQKDGEEGGAAEHRRRARVLEASKPRPSQAPQGRSTSAAVEIIKRSEADIAAG